MWYCQYWIIEQKLDQNKWNEFCELVNKIIETSYNWGIDLWDWFGENKPIVNKNEIILNWSINQRKNKWVHEGNTKLQWPSDDIILDKNNIGKTVWDWFWWELVNYPICWGDWSYEGFHMTRKLQKEFTKTNYFPYDITVTAILMLAKYIFWNKIIVCSDWSKKHWIHWFWVG